MNKFFLLLLAPILAQDIDMSWCNPANCVDDGTQPPENTMAEFMINALLPSTKKVIGDRHYLGCCDPNAEGLSFDGKAGGFYANEGKYSIQIFDPATNTPLSNFEHFYVGTTKQNTNEGLQPSVRVIFDDLGFHSYTCLKLNHVPGHFDTDAVEYYSPHTACNYDLEVWYRKPNSAESVFLFFGDASSPTTELYSSENYGYYHYPPTEFGIPAIFQSTSVEDRFVRGGKIGFRTGLAGDIVYYDIPTSVQEKGTIRIDIDPATGNVAICSYDGYAHPLCETGLYGPFPDSTEKCDD